MAQRVHILENDGEYRVQPPTVELDGGAGDQLIVKNNTSEDMVFYAPAKVFAADPVAKPIEAGKKITLTAASQGSGNSNAYAYQVIAPKSGKKAKGNSDPVIIVEN